jgi:hypothetical protein
VNGSFGLCLGTGRPRKSSVACTTSHSADQLSARCFGALAR